MSNNDDGSLVASSFALSTMQRIFDMDNSADVLALLKVAHQNTLDTDVQNSIRDLVFSYKLSRSSDTLHALQAVGGSLGFTITGTGSLGTTTQTQEQVATSGDTKTAVKRHVVPTRIGSGRPAPAFVKPTQTIVAPKVVSIKPVSITATPKPEVTNVAEGIHNEVLLQNEQTQTAAFVQQEEKANITTIPVTDAPKRINEIKQLVNAKVGNPVNLIDQDNQIGREYMNALLDAMKKSNGSSAEELSQAMGRLENAFMSVETLLGGTATPQVQEEKEEAQAVETAPSAVQDTPVITETAVVNEPKQIEPEQVSNTEEVVPEITPQSQSAEEPQENAPVVGYAAYAEKATAQQAAVPLVEVINNSVPRQEEQEPVTETSVPEIPTNTTLHSVAKDKQLEDLLRSKKEEELRSAEAKQTVSSSTDPLQTPEISAGLSQLLSEWSLFKSSGIFGTGPSGKDHALYLKLAPVPMAAIVAGRFEGATPKIKQSINDYMNGWRYEEGIVHEPSETFEQYLRRVIAHILTKRKK